MKKTIIIIVIVVVIAAIAGLGLYATKLYNNSDLLQYEIDTFSFPNLKLDGLGGIVGAIADLGDGWTQLDLTMKINNNSTSKYCINSMLLRLYDKENGTLIATPREPVKETIVIKPRTTNYINVKMDIQLAGLYALAKNVFGDGGMITRVVQLLKQYYTTGKIGADVYLDGNVTLKGLGLVKIPVQEEILF